MRRNRPTWIVNQLARGFGYDLVKRDSDVHTSLDKHVALFLKRRRINCVIDVGANVGQYAQSLRRAGYTGRIVSFEPSRPTFEALRQASAQDRAWQVHPFALGRTDGRKELVLCGNPLLSSFREPTERGRQHFGLDQSSRTEAVEVRRLDGLFASLTEGLAEPRVFLKLDTQGFDLEVFAGASGCAGAILGLQSELSVVRCYEGMPDYVEALSTYRRAGFEVTGFFPIFRVGHHLVIGECDAVLARVIDADEPPPEAGSGPRISVLVASLGESPKLDDTLRCLREQSREAGAELLLVLNTAPERVPAQRLEALAALCDRVLFEPQPGKSHALNAGIRACRGAIVAMSDDDASPQPGWLGALTAPLLDERRPVDLVGCGGRVLPTLPPTGVPAWYRALLADRRTHFLGPAHDMGAARLEYSLADRSRRGSPLGANCAYLRRVLLRHGYDPGLGPNRETGLRGGEDFALGLSLMREGLRILYCPDAVVHHDVTPERLTLDFVRRAYYVQGIEHVRLCRLTDKRLPSVARCRLKWLRAWLAYVGSAASGESRRVRKLCKQAFRRGMLAELSGHGPPTASHPEHLAPSGGSA